MKLYDATLPIQEGMVTLREAGIEKVRRGVTSMEEVLKRTIITKEAMPAYLVNPDVENYEDGDVIIREGNKGLDFFMLVQGALIVAKQGQKIAEIVQPGEYFGEMAAISKETRSASIISKGRSVAKDTIRRITPKTKAVIPITKNLKDHS